MIKESTHILENSSSCIDLIFTNEPNMVVESRVHHPLHQDCHHQIFIPKFNLKVHYLPPYERTFFSTFKRMLTIANKQLTIFLTGRMHYLILMLMSKYPFPILSWTSYITMYRMTLKLATTVILLGWTKKFKNSLAIKLSYILVLKRRQKFSQQVTYWRFAAKLKYINRNAKNKYLFKNLWQTS